MRAWVLVGPDGEPLWRSLGLTELQVKAYCSNRLHLDMFRGGDGPDIGYRIAPVECTVVEEGRDG